MCFLALLKGDMWSNACSANLNITAELPRIMRKKQLITWGCCHFSQCFYGWGKMPTEPRARKIFSYTLYLFVTLYEADTINGCGFIILFSIGKHKIITAYTDGLMLFAAIFTPNLYTYYSISVFSEKSNTTNLIPISIKQLIVADGHWHICHSGCND